MTRVTPPQDISESHAGMRRGLHFRSRQLRVAQGTLVYLDPCPLTHVLQLSRSTFQRHAIEAEKS